MTPTQKSMVWSFFKKSLDRKFVICTLCNRKLKYFMSTSNLKQHIIRRHNIQYKQLMGKDNPEAVGTVSVDSNGTTDVFLTGDNSSNFTYWSRNETLALINMNSNISKAKKSQWMLISEELEKIGIHKIPEKCEIKWKNLLRVYRQHKAENKQPDKFEFFNELDDVVSNDPELQSAANSKTSVANETSKIDKKRCVCQKNNKQKRHEDRMELMTKKLEIEERKVKAFEDYLELLKRNCEQNEAPWKATGAKRVGGIPANGPVRAVALLQFNKKLYKAWTSAPSTSIRLCSLLSISHSALWHQYPYFSTNGHQSLLLPSHYNLQDLAFQL
ncbi:hypothetical protein NQ315_005409 [Exocentrus adspersus]|uniref:Uncharacterized protein n=1 Tax=Exocentrus adspersus TaxID=1586481 RepID=A0AAV8W3C4_9CUCU|nr:hypothetical protein NQ315_005409 [Exocentrus adspersus]